jgi:HEAT repeat protein
MAAYVLGIIGNKESAPALKKLLDDPVSDVKWNAALGLARLGDGSGYPVLLKMLDRNDLAAAHGLSEDQIEKVMTNATKGLALIQKPESIKILETVARQDKNLKVRQAAMSAIHYKTSQDSPKNESL